MTSNPKPITFLLIQYRIRLKSTAKRNCTMLWALLVVVINGQQMDLGDHPYETCEKLALQFEEAWCELPTS